MARREAKSSLTQTLKHELLVPVRIQRAPLHLRLELPLPVGQEAALDERVSQSEQVHHRKVGGLCCVSGQVHA